MKSLIAPGTALLRDLYELPEPIVSVYLAMEEPAGDDVALRRRTVRHRLLRAATGNVVLEAVENALGDIPRGPGAVAVFIGRDGSVRRFDLPRAELVDRVRRSAIPDVVPFLRWQQYRPAYVLAALGPDDTEITVRRSPWSQVVTAVVPGPDDAGRDYSAYVAAAVTEALSESGAELLILVGDTKAVRHLHDKLPEAVREGVRVRTAPAGYPRALRGRGETWLAQVLAETVDAELREAVANLVEQSRPGGLGVQGIPMVIEALARGQIRELLIGADTDATAWFGPDATDISEHSSGLAVADAEKRQGPLADVLIRAATLTDAEVRILPMEMAEMSEALQQGVGGITRFSD